MGNILPFRDESGNINYDYVQYNYLFKPYDPRIIEYIYVNEIKKQIINEYCEIFVPQESFKKFNENASHMATDNKIGIAQRAAALTTLLVSERCEEPRYRDTIYEQLKKFPFPLANLFLYYSLFCKVGEDGRLTLHADKPNIIVVHQDEDNFKYHDIFKDLGYNSLYSIDTATLRHLYDKKTESISLTELMLRKNQIIVFTANNSKAPKKLLWRNIHDVTEISKQLQILPNNLIDINCNAYYPPTHTEPHILVIFGERHWPTREHASSYHDIIDHFIRNNREQMHVPMHLFIENGLENDIHEHECYTKYFIDDKHEYTDLTTNILSYHDIDEPRRNLYNIYKRILLPQIKDINSLLCCVYIMYCKTLRIYVDYLSIDVGDDDFAAVFSDIVDHVLDINNYEERVRESVKKTIKEIKFDSATCISKYHTCIEEIDEKVNNLLSFTMGNVSNLPTTTTDQKYSLLNNIQAHMGEKLRQNLKIIITSRCYNQLKDEDIGSSTFMNSLIISINLKILDLLFISKLDEIKKQSIILCLVGYYHLTGILEFAKIIGGSHGVVQISESKEYVMENKEKNEKFTDFQQQIIDITTSLVQTFKEEEPNDNNNDNDDTMQDVSGGDPTGFAAIIAMFIAAVIAVIMCVACYVVRMIKPTYTYPNPAGFTLRYAT